MTSRFFPRAKSIVLTLYVAISSMTLFAQTPDSISAVPVDIYELPKNALCINVGLGHVTSKIYTGEIAADAASVVNGLDFSIGYDYMFNPKIGFGIQYSGFKSRIDIGTIHNHLLISMIGPQLVLKQRINNGRTIFEERIGLGYYNAYQWIKWASKQYTGSSITSSSSSGFASTVQLGVEYLISPKVGLSLSIGAVTGSLSNPGVELPDGEKSGINRLFIDAGVRYHF